MRQKQKRRIERQQRERRVSELSRHFQQLTQYFNSAECQRCYAEFNPAWYSRCPSCFPNQYKPFHV